MKTTICLFSLALCCFPALVGATPVTLTSTFTVDDSYRYYISTDDSVLGTQIGWDEDWYVAESYSATLVPNVTNYIHVVANDDHGVIAAFLGQFTLSDSSFHFTNGTQSLVTNADDWNVSRTGFAQDYERPTEIAENGGAIWGSITKFSTISSTASWIWTNDGMDLYTTRYFSAAIIPDAGSSIPEPATFGLFLLGMTGWIRKRIPG